MAKAGQRVAVTERGKLVAYLVPAEDAGTLLDRLAASGDYLPPAAEIGDLLPPPTIPQGRRPLSEVVAPAGCGALRILDAIHLATHCCCATTST